MAMTQERDSKPSSLWPMVLVGILAGLTGCAEADPDRLSRGRPDPTPSEILEQMRRDYEDVGKADVFEKLVAESDISITTCADGYRVSFTPKGWEGFDGDFAYSMDRDLKQGSSMYDAGLDCEVRWEKVSFP